MSPDQGPLPAAVTAGIVAAIAGGDERALGALYDTYGSVAYSLAYAITGTHAAAEAAVASAFADAWRGAAAFDASRTSVLAWLTSLVRKASFGAAPRERRLAQRAAGANPVPASSAPTPVGRALGALTEAQRRVLELSYFRGLSVPEIAAQLGEPESGTRELLRSAMNDLRSALSPIQTFEDKAVTRA